MTPTFERIRAIFLSVKTLSRLYAPTTGHCLFRTLIPVGSAWLVWGLLAPIPHPELLSGAPTKILFLGVLVFVLMLGCVFSVVRQAETLAELLKEPLGTLVLTLSSTMIEVSLMLGVMLEGAENPTLLRDTVFATLMLSMNGLVGLALVGGGWRHLEQSFNLRGALSFLHLIAPLCLLVLILPNFTRSTDGPTLAPHQEAFLGALCVVVYLLFLLIQTGRHRSFFDHIDAASSLAPCGVTTSRSLRVIAWSAFILILSLLPIVLLADSLGAVINYGIDELRAPTALGGLIIASLGLMSEGLGSFRAAVANRMQRAVNICLGSALSTIGLTVPTVLIAAGWLNMELTLGLDGSNATLLGATLLSAVLTFVSGSSNILQGIVHLMLFAGYVIFILLP